MIVLFKKEKTRKNCTKCGQFGHFNPHRVKSCSNKSLVTNLRCFPFYFQIPKGPHYHAIKLDALDWLINLTRTMMQPSLTSLTSLVKTNERKLMSS